MEGSYFFHSFLFWFHPSFLPTPNLALTYFLPLENFYLLSSFSSLAPEQGLLLVVVGSCSVIDWNYTHSFLKPAGVCSFPDYRPLIITGASYFFGTIVRNKLWFQRVVNSNFWFCFFGCWCFLFSRCISRSTEYHLLPGFKQSNGARSLIMSRVVLGPNLTGAEFLGGHSLSDPEPSRPSDSGLLTTILLFYIPKPSYIFL